MLPGVQVEHEIGQRPLHARSEAPIDGEARASDFGGALKVQNADARGAVIASTASQTLNMRAARGMPSPESPSGYPLPSQRSW